MGSATNREIDLLEKNISLFSTMIIEDKKATDAKIQKVQALQAIKNEEFSTGIASLKISNAWLIRIATASLTFLSALKVAEVVKLF